MKAAVTNNLPQIKARNKVGKQNKKITKYKEKKKLLEMKITKMKKNQMMMIKKKLKKAQMLKKKKSWKTNNN